MPVPLRDDGSPGPIKRLVVFVHGFNSNATACWGDLLKRLNHDDSLLIDFDFDSFQYETMLFKANALKRIPTLDELGGELEGYLERKLIDPRSGNERYINATLIGHSMGGLVIQSYLSKCLSSGRGSSLDRIRQIVFFATPHHGSDLMSAARRILFALFSNPQEESLRSLNQELKLIHRGIREHVIDAHSRGKYSYPLPSYCFWGDSDNVVPEWSARGHFPNGEPLPGDHLTINKPRISDIRIRADDTEQRDCYDSLIDLLITPRGHPHIWEVDRFIFRVQVKPLPQNTTILARHGTKQRSITTDNLAIVTREIKFGRHNKCLDPFTLRYATRGDGWIDADMPIHVTSPEKLRQYDDTGTEVIAEVEPEAGKVSRLSMKVYKGFDQGHRDYHMHLGKRSYFRKLEYEVDLSGYIAAGWRVIYGPHLYFHPSDPGDHRLCSNRDMLDPDPPHDYNARGIWRWTLEHVKEGVVDIVWDVAPSEQSAIRESPGVIDLRPGEHAIFGYGSLLSRASLERTLGRPYTGPFVQCDLLGWRRVWNVSMPNTSFVYKDQGVWVTPKRIAYLNLASRLGGRVNGIVFVINENDLNAFDEREWIYERVAINDQLRGLTVMNGSAWAFVGRQEHCVDTPSDRRSTAVRTTYLSMLEAGFKELGSSFISGYEQSTDPVPTELIIDDHKRDERLSGAT
jgi:pimeloyl-ACP methyl ester carboxylesterase/cation transport regulator ChaC